MNLSAADVRTSITSAFNSVLMWEYYFSKEKAFFFLVFHSNLSVIARFTSCSIFAFIHLMRQFKTMYIIIWKKKRRNDTLNLFANFSFQKAIFILLHRIGTLRNSFTFPKNKEKKHHIAEIELISNNVRALLTYSRKKKRISPNKLNRLENNLHSATQTNCNLLIHDFN